MKQQRWTSCSLLLQEQLQHHYFLFHQKRSSCPSFTPLFRDCMMMEEGSYTLPLSKSTYISNRLTLCSSSVLNHKQCSVVRSIQMRNFSTRNDFDAGDSERSDQDVARNNHPPNSTYNKDVFNSEMKRMYKNTLMHDQLNLDDNKKNSRFWIKALISILSIIILLKMKSDIYKAIYPYVRPHLPRIRNFLLHYSQLNISEILFHADVSIFQKLEFMLFHYLAILVQLLEGTYRFSRVASVGISCLWDYYTHYDSEEWREQVAREERHQLFSKTRENDETNNVHTDASVTTTTSMESHAKNKSIIDQIHKRNAEKFLSLFTELGGIFVKIGQYMSSMTNFLPDAWTTTLQVLQDKVPSEATLEEIKSMFEEEHLLTKSQTFEAIFERFEAHPIAAASLAQVHKAKLRKGSIPSLKGTDLDGTEVAVKVQYPSIRYYYKGDMIAKGVALSIIQFFFPHYNISWMGSLLDETLNQELDFRIEKSNAEKITSLFAQEEEGMKRQLYIPRVISSLSSKRLLTMEFIDGVKISDTDKLRQRFGENGIVEAASITFNAFAKMIFLHSFLHTDPHPGNILVRAHPNYKNRVQVVLIDHGLYQKLSHDFSVNFGRFWRALVLKDNVFVKKYCQDLGIEDYQLYASIILMRGYDDTSDVGLFNHGTKKEFESFIKGIIEHRMERFQQMIRNMPSEMLLIMRTNNLLRYVNQSLGVPVNRYVIYARVASKGIHRHCEMSSRHHNSTTRIISLWKYLKEKSVIAAEQIHFETILALYQLKQWLWNWYYRQLIFIGFMKPIRLRVEKNDLDVVLAA
ncbi:hypothetical protein FDP41_012082 [Naegleria fowleri]|uniref:ABC1 atypical kinase-like domain-containing protein n=1 Tax=Naegleria fowleri TaxID=5763 RepID=A0A6A5C7G7_NAEFO|nr:uncharacterized protein FDP41_012082 [Naegleria fowleri]KAF0981425.1 hypothetical protein FDP41_012082 [Naegleria fowleri]